MVDPEGWAMRYRELFGDREFRALFVADVMSITGSYLARVAVAGLVFHRTGSATLTALAFAVSYAPYLLSPWLSSLADLFPRRMLLILCDLARAVCIGLILVPGLALPFVMALLFLEATWRIPWGAARLALLTDILSPEAFPAGNALIASVRQALQVGGFAVGGVVVALIGVRPTLAFDAFTFLLSAAIVVVAVRRRAAPWRTRRVAVTAGAPSPARAGEQPGTASDRATDVRPGTWVSTVEGVRSVVRNPKMVQLFALLGLGPAMAVITEGLAVPFAADLGGGLAAGRSHHGGAAAGHGDRAVRTRATPDGCSTSADRAALPRRRVWPSCWPDWPSPSRLRTSSCWRCCSCVADASPTSARSRARSA